MLPLESVTVSIKNPHCVKTHHKLIINSGIVGIVVGYGLNVRGTVVRFRTEERDHLVLNIFVYVRGTVFLGVKRPGHEAERHFSLQDVRVCAHTGYEISAYGNL